MNRKEKFLELLDKMKLTDKYPQKLSLRDAMTIRQETLGTVHTTDQLAVLPYLILQKMMMCDQRCRSCLYKPTSDSTSDSGIESSSLHPVDCMLIILHCCDDILRQNLISKLSLCQLAIPFLLPSPTDNSVTFLLWAMRSLVKSWKRNRTGGKEHRIVDYQGPIISFLRISNSPSSKSEILNAVIGGGLFYFFNCRECEGGDCKRYFVDGLVEMCCYLPSGEDTDHFTDAVTFLNLRGDAQTHTEQVEFLQTISFMSVVLIAKENINDDTIKALQSLTAVTESGEIILLLDEEVSQTETNNTTLELLHQALPENRCIKVELKNKDMATIATEIRKLLRAKIDNATPEHFKSINDCYEAAYEADFKVDEEGEDCKFGKWNAKVVMEKLHSAEFNKDEILPLQGPSLWQQWAKHDKEQHCIEENKATSVTAQIDAEMMEIRKKQFNMCTKLTPVMDSFTRFLLDKNANIRRYFLQWLKLLLDDHSREILPKLLAEYQETRAQLSAASTLANQPEENSRIKELTKKLKILNEGLINASFGLEHLFREMGQIYEARMDSDGYEVPQILKNKANHFCRVMAEIMDEGHALELMDGDASHVPTLWVLAVIEMLKAVCGKNAREKNGGKIFVLSVLGIQSTGKSTLLNTMFGLHFNVSAGRCTRGAYIQLLPLNNSLRQMIDCDYVLIVDTEGLRAPELQLEGLKHDNELATFVIGLADATIINIFAETPGDLDDILQTLLHSFICMSGKVEINPSCVFAYQRFLSVTPVTSRLDAMTRVIAQVENCEGWYNSFNRVIDFDESNDVFYFPSLWKGDPPMAPINTDYSESAQTLKTALLERRQIHRCSLETFKLRTKDLWSVVVQNSLKVSVYNEIEVEYAKWSRMLKSEITKWKNTTKTRINNCDPKNEKIKEASQMCFIDAEKMLDTIHKEVLDKMKSFFNESSYSDVLSQWERRTEEKIKKLFDKSEEQAKSYCDDLVRIKTVSTDIENLEQDKLSVYVRQLVYKSEREDVEYSEVELEENFEAKWEDWAEYFSGEIGDIVTDGDPLQKLHQKKHSCLIQFKSKYEKLREDRERIRKFCGLLRDSFIVELEQKVVNEIRRDEPILTNKSACNIQVLKDLANTNDFDSYIKYLLNTSEWFCDWIKTYIEKHCSSKTITGPAQDAILHFKKCVTDAINSLRDKSITDMDTWINELVNCLDGVVSLSQPKIGGLVGLCDAKEFSTDFPDIFKEMTAKLEKKYSDAKSIITQLDHRGSSPVKVLQKRLIGCFVMCPLCNEICRHTSAGHSGDHSVKVHRPACLGKRRWIPTYKLALLTCTEIVESKITYQRSENDSFEFSQYRDWYPRWDIPDFSHNDPKYWKWFICKYEHKLVAVLDATGADIPPDWHNITKSEAISSLDYMY